MGTSLLFMPLEICFLLPEWSKLLCKQNRKLDSVFTIEANSNSYERLLKKEWNVNMIFLRECD